MPALWKAAVVTASGTTTKTNKKLLLILYSLFRQKRFGRWCISIGGQFVTRQVKLELLRFGGKQQKRTYKFGGKCHLGQKKFGGAE